MKKLLLIFLVVFVAQSCEDSLDGLNVDKKNPSEVQAGTLFANSTVTLFDFMASTNVNVNNFRLWAQYWAQTTYADESNYELNERNVTGRAWDRLYATVIRDLREALPLIQDDQFLTAENKKNQLAIMEVVEVFAYSLLVDMFGDIPYSQSLTEDVTPAYDDDAVIYSDLISRLDVAIGNLSGASALGGSDLVYGGDVAQWRKFANSFKLRMAIRIADMDAAKAGMMVSQAVTDGVMESDADNFALTYTSSTPNTNPLWEDLVQSGRSDFIAANTLVDVMNNLNDPRRAGYFSGPVDMNGDPIGGIYGDNNNYNANSHPGTVLEDPTYPAAVLDFTEVQFLLADAAERNFSVGRSAEDYYNAGVTNSILFWGGSATDASDYLAQADVAYSTAPGTWKEKIAMQKWLAMYNRGFEGWTTYRVYDAPTMNMAAQAGILPPNRYTYPVTEYSLNGENVQAAGTAIGGDNLTSKVFWDVN